MMRPFSQHLRAQNLKLMLLTPLQELPKQNLSCQQVRKSLPSTMAKSLDSLDITPVNNMPGRLLVTLPSFSRDSLDTGTVQVIVGQRKREFTMHKGVLCNVAPFFRAAFE